jgi:electron transfer flavoprotein beta subunit
MESTDGYTGTVPQMMSEILDVPCLSFARKVDVEDGNVAIERQTASGYEVVSASLPALLAVTAGVVEPRYPTFKGIMQAKSKPLDTLTATDLGVEPHIGQTISGVTDVEARESGTVIEDEGEAYLKIVEILEQTKVI